MANEIRKYQNFIGGLIEDNPLTSGATTLNSAGLASISGGVPSTDHMAIVLDPDGLFGAPEIVHITAHTAATTSCTIGRGKEGTTARAHDRDVPWIHGPTVLDQPKTVFTRRTSGDLTLNNTSWTNVDTGMDLVIPDALVGMFVTVELNGRWITNASVWAALDVVSIVGGSPVNSWATDGAPDASGNGVGSWMASSGQYAPFGGAIGRRIVSGDISGGTVTLRIRYRTLSAANRLLGATSTDEFYFRATRGWN